MAKKDYYELLGVGREAAEKDIHKAFRRLAKKWHPDRHKGDAEAEKRFKEINEAHQVLSDQKKRAQYDQMGRAGFFGGEGGRPGAGFDSSMWENLFGGGGGAGRPGPHGQSFRYEDLGGFGDIFSQLFRHEAAPGAGMPSRGQDIRTRLRIPFQLAVKGGRIAVTVPRPETCHECGGTGGQTHPCMNCHGSGMVQTVQGGFALSRPCPQCGGQGRIITKACAACHGAGQVAREKRYQVRVPQGVHDGQVIRLAGQGQPGTGGPAGDLLVEIAIAPDAAFERQGNDIHSEVPVNIVQATLGTQLVVNTVQGAVNLRIPPGAASGTQLRLRGKGVHAENQPPGDHYVRIRIVPPKDLTDEQKAQLTRFAESAGLER